MKKPKIITFTYIIKTNDGNFFPVPFNTDKDCVTGVTYGGYSLKRIKSPIINKKFKKREL